MDILKEYHKDVVTKIALGEENEKLERKVGNRQKEDENILEITKWN